MELDNEILQSYAISVLLYGGLVLAFGTVILPFLLIQTAFAWWQLTSANYIEHYGLLREKRPNGRYERCQPHHSWNANHLASNLLLFHLERHSDHHAYATRRYQSLRHYDRCAAAAQRLFRHVPVGLRSAALVPGHESKGP